MADKGGKSKRSKRQDPSVLGALPATRPARLSRRARDGEGELPAGPTSSKVEAAASKAGAKAGKPSSRKPAAPKAMRDSAAARAGVPAKAAAAEAGAKARSPRAAAKPKAAAPPPAVPVAGAVPPAVEPPVPGPPIAGPPVGEPPVAEAPVDESPVTPRKAGPVPLAAADQPRPRAVRAANPELRGPAQKASAHRPEGDEEPADVLATVLQAAGGFVGLPCRVLKGVRGRLPF